jgi:hydrophobic/amphiphilic exporter-1 (mainly G- bacteria), HAE1 family
MKTLVSIAVVAITLGGCVSTTSFSSPGTIVSVETRMPGASPETVETTIVKPIESALVALDGVERVHSTSGEGRSYVEVYFKAKEQAKHLQQVRSAVEAIQPTLPPSATVSLVVVRETPVLR